MDVWLLGLGCDVLSGGRELRIWSLPLYPVLVVSCGWSFLVLLQVGSPRRVGCGEPWDSRGPLWTDTSRAAVVVDRKGDGVKQKCVSRGFARRSMRWLHLRLWHQVQFHSKTSWNCAYICDQNEWYCLYLWNVLSILNLLFLCEQSIQNEVF